MEIRPGGCAVLAALGLLVVGCASIRVKAESSPSAPFLSYRSFDWVSPADSSDDPRFPGFRRAGRAEIAARLREKGYEQVAPGKEPDFRVQFYAYVQQEQQVLVDEQDVHEAETPQPDVPPDNSEAPGHPGEDQSANVSEGEDLAIEDIDLSDLETGDLVVEAVDDASGKLVWRGTGKGVANENAPQRELLKALDKVMDRFPEIGTRP